MKTDKTLSGAGVADGLVVVDVAPGTDLTEALLDACRARRITSGVIIFCIGSLRQATVENVAVDSSIPNGVGFSAQKVYRSPLQLLSGQGCVGLDAQGEPFIHLHIVFYSGETGQIHGGHAEPGGNISVNRLEAGIITSKELQITTELDPSTGFLHLVPKGPA